MSSILREVKTQVAKTLPAAEEKRAVQLPVPLTPFDRYRRQKLIKIMHLQELVGGKSVLEIGCGIGDVLLEVSRFGPRELYGVDASEEMIGLARQFLEGIKVDLLVNPSHRLPFPEKSFDVVILMFEFQFLDDEEELEKRLYEATRVARQWLVLVENTSPQARQEENHIARPVEFYKMQFSKKRFHLRRISYLDESASRFFFTGSTNPLYWIRWILSPLLYLMGFPKSWMRFPSGKAEQPDSGFALFWQKITLPLISGFDDLFSSDKGITVMRFERHQIFRR